MKTIVLKSLALALFFAIASTAGAQTEQKQNTSESFGSQVKNGRVPGWVFAPETPMLQRKEEKLVAPKYSIRDILNGKVPIAPAAGVQPVQQTQQAASKPAGNVQLASSEAAKKPAPAVTEKPVTPSQEPHN